MGPFDWYGFNFTGWDARAFSNHVLVDKGLKYIIDEGSNLITIDWAVRFNTDGSISQNQDSAPPFSDIAYVVSAAKALGLTVFLKPHTATAATGENLNESNVDPLKFSINKHLTDWKVYLENLANFATDNHADGITIGTESPMVDTQSRDLWSDLISSVRHNFSGYLTYDALIRLSDAAPDVNDVVFWDLLDFISVSFYVQLSKNDNATVAELNAAWLNNSSGDIPNVIDYLERISKKFGKPIVFGESGFQSATGALWDLNSYPSQSKQVNYDLQSHGIQSLLDTFTHYKGDWLKGINLWQVRPDMMSNAMLASIDHTQEFTTYGKPAAQIIKDWFTGKNTYSNTNFLGTVGNDTIIASFGNDVVRGGSGNNLLSGGPGNDIIYGNGINTPTSTVITVGAQGDMLDKVGPKFNVVVNGKNVVIDQEVHMTRDEAIETFTFTIPYVSSIESLSISFNNEEYRGSGLDRNLYIRQVTFDDIALIKAGTIYKQGFGLPTLTNTWEMGAGGSLLIDITPVDFLKKQASNNTNFLSGGAGNDTLIGSTGNDTATYSGSLSNYTLVKNGNVYSVQDKTNTDGTDTLTNIESLQFSDKSVNLNVQSIAASAVPSEVQHIIELYVAFFNRIPDADGLAYWIGQKISGATIGQISESFYSAGASAEYSNLTGFSSNMSNADFINLFYENVLGRTGGADPEGLAYWNNQLINGTSSRSSLALDILNSAHTFKGDSSFGYVADLLDNKISVAHTVAIDWGITYNTDAYTKGVAIAAAITSSSVIAALALVGVSTADMHLL